MFCFICNQEIDYKRHCDFIKFHLKPIHQINGKEYFDRYLKKDEAGTCLTCGKQTKFISLKKGYSKYCSNKCTGNRKNIKSAIIKRQQTLKEKYGSTNYFNLEKSKQTKLKRYGNSNYNNVNKIKQTKLERYEDANYNNVDKISEYWNDENRQKQSIKFSDFVRKNINYLLQKTRTTKLKRYGNVNYNNKIKISETNLKKQFNHVENIIKKLSLNVKLIDYKLSNLILFCNQCQKYFEISLQMFYKRSRNKEDICNICNPYNLNNYSKVEKELVDFIKNLNFKVSLNDRSILNGKELDIYIPELKLAFEFNGLYWHSELYKDKNYHLRKTEECEKQGIHLVHIYEDDWIYKQDIVKSRILNLLGKSQKIYARKTEIKEVSYKDSKEFLEQNHIQGNCISKIRLGLYYNCELVSLMTFGKLRKSLGWQSKEGSYELLRFCNKINITVVGGANRLFKLFIKKYNPKTIISYADRSWTMNNGNTLYDKLRFKLDSITDLNYCYIKSLNRINRFRCRKDLLVKQGFDKNKTEHEIMLERNYYRLYDSGNLKYEWKNE